MENFSDTLSQALEPTAAWFRTFAMPDPIIHWGHPMMMGIVLVAMGGYVGWTGWQVRLNSTEMESNQKQRAEHRKVAPLMFMFIAMGYTGGVLSLVMQNHHILESPHFISGTAIILLLGTNGILAATNFGNTLGLRTAHAYIGSIALALFAVHAILGIRLGLSL